MDTAGIHFSTFLKQYGPRPGPCTFDQQGFSGTQSFLHVIMLGWVLRRQRLRLHSTLGLICRFDHTTFSSIDISITTQPNSLFGEALSDLYFNSSTSSPAGNSTADFSAHTTLVPLLDILDKPLEVISCQRDIPENESDWFFIARGCSTDSTFRWAQILL